MFSIITLASHFAGLNEYDEQEEGPRARNYCAIKAALFLVSLYAMEHLKFKNDVMNLPKGALNIGKDVVISILLSPEAGTFRAIEAICRQNLGFVAKIGAICSTGFVGFHAFGYEARGIYSLSFGGLAASRLTGLSSAED